MIYLIIVVGMSDGSCLLPALVLELAVPLALPRLDKASNDGRAILPSSNALVAVLRSCCLQKAARSNSAWPLLDTGMGCRIIPNA